MNTWFLCKAKYQKIDETGKENMVSEQYLVDAVSFTEAETRINKELEPYINGEFFVVVIKIANFAEVVQSDEGGKWFKCKVSFIAIDEERGIEKRSSVYMLVKADNVALAYSILTESLSHIMSDYEIPSVQESPIIDVFKYGIE